MHFRLSPPTGFLLSPLPHTFSHHRSRFCYYFSDLSLTDSSSSAPPSPQSSLPLSIPPSFLVRSFYNQQDRGPGLILQRWSGEEKNKNQRPKAPGFSAAGEVKGSGGVCGAAPTSPPNRPGESHAHRTSMRTRSKPRPQSLLRSLPVGVRSPLPGDHRRRLPCPPSHIWLPPALALTAFSSLLP